MKPQPLALCLVALAVGTSPAATLAPDDPAVSSSLRLWLTNAAGNFNAGTWSDSSGNGNDAATVGTVNVSAPVTFLSPAVNNAAATIDAANSSAVAFSANTDDLLRAPAINGGTGFSALTIFSVYNITNIGGNPNLTRPLGIGSVAGSQANPGNHFNLSSDPSVRKDNGQIGAGSYSAAAVTGQSFIRISSMDTGGVDEWFNTTATLNPVLTNFATAFTTSNDDFYLGDLRGGNTPVPGFGAAVAPSDFEISQVIVFNTSLTDQQVAGINEWIVTTVPEPSTTGLVAIAAAAGLLRRHRS